MGTRYDNGKFSKAARLRSNSNLHRGPSSLNTLDRTGNEDIIEWKNGRRIVELGKLAEGLGVRWVRVLYFALHDPGRGGPWGSQF